jgi:hypothetical protein
MDYNPDIEEGYCDSRKSIEGIEIHWERRLLASSGRRTPEFDAQYE